MTKQDLKLEYKRTTGEYPINSDEIEVKACDAWAILEFQEYVDWLEDELIICNKVKNT